MQYTYRMQMMQ